MIVDVALRLGILPWELERQMAADADVTAWVSQLHATFAADAEAHAAQQEAAAQAREHATLQAQGRTPIAGPSAAERAEVERRSGLRPGASLGR